MTSKTILSFKNVEICYNLSNSGNFVSKNLLVHSKTLVRTSISEPHRKFLHIKTDKMYYNGSNMDLEFSKETKIKFDFELIMFSGDIDDSPVKYNPVISFSLYAIMTTDGRNRIGNMICFGKYHYEIVDLYKNRSIKGKLLQMKAFSSIVNTPERSCINFDILPANEKSEIFFNKSYIEAYKKARKQIDFLTEKQNALIINFLNKTNNSPERIKDLRGFYNISYSFGNLFSLPLDMFQLLTNFDIKLNVDEEVYLNFIDNYQDFSNEVLDKEFFKTLTSHIINHEKDNAKESIYFINNKGVSVLQGIFLNFMNLFPYFKDYSFYGEDLIMDDVYSDVFTNMEGDCEDYSLSLYRLIKKFMACSFQDYRLRVINNLLSLYSPCLGKIILNCESLSTKENLKKSDLHTVVFLIPKKQSLLNKILFDGTVRMNTSNMDFKYEEYKHYKEKIDIMKKMYSNGLSVYDVSIIRQINPLYEERLKSEIVTNNEEEKALYPYYNYVLSLHFHPDDVKTDKKGNICTSFLCYQTDIRGNTSSPVDFRAFMYSDNVYNKKVHLKKLAIYNKEDFLGYSKILNIEHALYFPEIRTHDTHKDVNTINSDKIKEYDSILTFEVSILNLNVSSFEEDLRKIVKISIEKGTSYSLSIKKLYYCHIKDREVSSLLVTLNYSK